MSHFPHNDSGVNELSSFGVSKKFIELHLLCSLVWITWYSLLPMKYSLLDIRLPLSRYVLKAVIGSKFLISWGRAFQSSTTDGINWHYNTLHGLLHSIMVYFWHLAEFFPNWIKKVRFWNINCNRKDIIDPRSGIVLHYSGISLLRMPMLWYDVAEESLYFVCRCSGTMLQWNLFTSYTDALVPCTVVY